MSNIKLDIPRDKNLVKAAIGYLERELSILTDPNGLTPEETTLGMEIESKIPSSEGGTKPDPVKIFGGAPAPVPPVPGSAEHCLSSGAPHGVETVIIAPESPIVDSMLTPEVMETPIPDIAPTAVDSTGLPWDGRINVSTKTIRKSDNTWTLRRNMDPLIVDQVRTELRNLMAGVELPINSDEKKATDILTPAPTPVVNTDEEVFPAFLNKLTPRLSSPQGAAFKIRMDAVLKKQGIAQAGLLMSTPEKIPVIDALLEEEWNKLITTPA